jgi:NAD(P)-dependent dehydrogenase (short-subunit alcohol dehydrogenase family)
VWVCMKHELAQMRTQASGAIVNCSSLGGLVGLPGRAAYHASKHGVIGLTRSAALEYAPRGIRINAICPGTIDTPMVAEMIAKGELDLDVAINAQPIHRLGQPEEIAAAVLWLCSDASSFGRCRAARRRRLHRAMTPADAVQVSDHRPQGEASARRPRASPSGTTPVPVSRVTTASPEDEQLG